MNETHVAEADQLKDERVMRKKQIFRETKGKSDTENRCALYIIICLTRQIFFFAFSVLVVATERGDSGVT